ncbi:hypothetical protein ACIPQH_25300 [Streptomyces rubiginosohelvolus]|uniref:hypothetical protein n=1 Tax=Streptomyces rubiginosohelvolus TaxID=67362 RepID=UPI0038028D63
MRYYLSENGGAMTVSGDPGPFGVTIPPGYREVTEEEYNAATGVETVPLPPEPPAEGPAPGEEAAEARRAQGE